MNNREMLARFSKDELIDLIGIYAKNWLAMDGVWFQSIEQKHGMDEAMYHDAEAWRRFTVIEARRIKELLQLPQRAGTEGLAKALRLRFYGSLNRDTITMDEKTLVYRMEECRVQTARMRKGMELHPCKSVGEIEYAGFAGVIDDRFVCECLSCHPERSDPTCCCAWRFTLQE